MNDEQLKELLARSLDPVEPPADLAARAAAGAVAHKRGRLGLDSILSAFPGRPNGGTRSVVLAGVALASALALVIGGIGLRQAVHRSPAATPTLSASPSPSEPEPTPSPQPVAAVSPGVTPSSTAGAAPACDASNSRMEVATDFSQYAMGQTVNINYWLHNISSKPCETVESCSPTAGVSDYSRTEIWNARFPGAGICAVMRTVELPPGGTTSVNSVSWNQHAFGSGPGASCGRQVSAGIYYAVSYWFNPSLTSAPRRFTIIGGSPEPSPSPSPTPSPTPSPSPTGLLPTLGPPSPGASPPQPTPTSGC